MKRLFKVYWQVPFYIDETHLFQKNKRHYFYVVTAPRIVYAENASEAQDIAEKRERPSISYTTFTTTNYEGPHCLFEIFDKMVKDPDKEEHVIVQESPVTETINEIKTLMFATDFREWLFDGINIKNDNDREIVNQVENVI